MKRYSVSITKTLFLKNKYADRVEPLPTITIASTLTRLRIRRNDADTRITPVDGRSARAHARGTLSRVRTRPRKIVHGAIEKPVVLKERRHDALHKGLVCIKVGGNRRLDLVRRDIEDVFEDETTDLGGGLRAEIDAERDEVVEAFVAAEFAGIEEEDTSGFHEG